MLGVLRRRGLPILLCGLVLGAVAFGVSALKERQYSATATLLFRNPGVAEALFGSDSPPSAVTLEREAATNQKLVGLSVVGDRVAKRIEGLSPQAISRIVSVTSGSQVDLVSVMASSHQPAQAREVANTYARQFIAFRAENNRKKLVKSQRLVEQKYNQLSRPQRGRAPGRELRASAAQLAALASLQSGGAVLVEPAQLPTSPSSPKPVRNGIIGVVLGLLVGLAGAFLFERLSRRLKTTEEVQEAFDLPILAIMPESRAMTIGGENGAAAELPPAEKESLEELLAAIRDKDRDTEIHSVLITASRVGAGASTVAWNLARAASNSVRVVIVETQIRQRSLAHPNELGTGPGLAELLAGQVSLGEVIQSKAVSLGHSAGSDAAASYDAILAGTGSPNSAQLIASDTMREIHTRLRERYDLIIFDTAPISVVPDAFPLLREVDGVVIVTLLGQDTRDHAKQLRQQLRRLGAPTLGVVANGMRPHRGKRASGDYDGQPLQKQSQASESIPS